MAPTRLTPIVTHGIFSVVDAGITDHVHTVYEDYHVPNNHNGYGTWRATCPDELTAKCIAFAMSQVFP